MRRKKQNVFEDYVPSIPARRSYQDIPLQYTESRAIQQFPRSTSSSVIPDSLQRFQQEIQRNIFLQQASRNMPRSKKRTYTQVDEEEEMFNKKQSKQIAQLQTQLSDIKGEIINRKQSNHFGDKLDQLMDQMAKNRQMDRQFMRQQMMRQNVPPQMPSPIFYPPPQYPYPPPYPQIQTPRYPKDSSDSQYSRPKFKPRSRARRLLRKHFFTVAFVSFLKSQSKKLAQRRKTNLRTFYLQKFNSQMLNLKNWLVQGHSYAFPVVLQKQKFSFNFWKQSRPQVAKEKQALVLQIVQIGLQKLKKQCTPQKVSHFSEILYNICSKGSFVMSRFWSAFQMKHLCISQYFGCVRADESLMKMMLTLMVFIKVLVFNMLLQPYKFDSVNFPKKRQPLTFNMYVIGSVYYRLAKQLAQEYFESQRKSYYKVGNWLKVPQNFIVQCCEPLLYDCEYPEEDQWITGMLGKQIDALEENSQWGALRGRMRQIIQQLYVEMLKRRKDVVRNQKYKLYN